jgi:hypothetical protein
MASATPTAPVNQQLTEPTAEQRREQLIRVLNSRTFQNGPLLQKFLEFVVGRSIDGRLEDLNEYAIATQVLGRRDDFDPAVDTSVRTQAYRLRTKLKEYYATEGKADPLLIEIPKGHYRPAFSMHVEDSTTLGASGGIAVRANQDAAMGVEYGDHGLGQARRRSWLIVSGLAFLTTVIFLAGILVGWRSASANYAAKETAKIDKTLGEFWRRPSVDSGIVLAFTNPVFLETNTGDLLAYRGGAVADRGALVGKEDSQTTARDSGLAGRVGPLYYEDGFTGTGEVIAVHRITYLLRSLNVNLVVERSRVLSPADFRNHDVVFLGSPTVNNILDQISLPKRFTFELPHSSPYLWQEVISDNKAAPSTNHIYRVERDPQTHVIMTDYAFFDVFPGASPEHRIILLAGLTTTGTQGAATFATSPEGLRQLRDLLGHGIGNGETVPVYFECLLRVDAVKGLDALNVNPVSCSSLQADK